jgi:hypothetical protein
VTGAAAPAVEQVQEVWRAYKGVLRTARAITKFKGLFKVGAWDFCDERADPAW